MIECHCGKCERLQGQVNILRQGLEDIAEHECSYGDNCPTFGSNHYQCLQCKARETLEKAEQQ